MKVAVVSAITGRMDIPKEFPAQTVGHTYHSFTENDFADDHAGLNNRTKALYFKTQMHYMAQADLYVWLDGKIQVLSPNFLAEIIAQLGNNDFAMLKHGERDCIYKEVDYIRKQVRRGNAYLMARYGDRPLLDESQRYWQDGYPINNGLTDCSIFIWRFSARMNALMDAWWAKVSDQKSFDQIAIQYLAWKQGVKIIPLYLPNQFKLVKHLRNNA